MKTVLKFLFIPFIALCTVLAPTRGQSQNLQQQIDLLIADKMTPAGPGGVFLVAQGDEVLYRKAFGLANLELGVSMEPGHVFQIGSMTKQFTAIAILKLMEEGKLNPDDDIRRFIPDYPSTEGPVTIYQLLSHTSGIRNFTEMQSIMEIAQKEISTEELIGFFMDEPMDFAPGTGFKYNNSGYAMLGYIIERASGKTYEDYVESELFAPAGMSHSRYTHYREIIPGRAYGYHKREEYTNKMHVSMSIPYASGALMSTVDDLLKWQRSLLSGRLIRKRTLEMAFTPKKLKDGRSVDYGFGWHVKALEDTRSLEHGGSIFGFKSMGVYLPEKDLYVVGLTNCDCISPTQLTRDIAVAVIQSL